MAKDDRIGRALHYEYPYFENFVEPQGALSIDRRSHACWYYVTLAMRARALHNGGIENQIIQVRVGDEADTHWHESRDEEIARSVAVIYQLESPDEFLKDEFKKRAWAQAQALGRTVHPDVWEVRPGVTRLH